MGKQSHRHHAATEGAIDMKTRPGKYVNPQDLEEAKRRYWDSLMENARLAARQRSERVRVVGVKGRERHDRWTYVIDCPSWCGCRKW